MPKEAYGVAALISAVIAAAFLGTYSGPYRLISDLQITLFHINFVTLSFLLTMALVCAVLCGLVYFLEKKLGTRETWFTPRWNNLDRFFDLPPGKALLVGGTLLVMGSFFALKDLGRGALTQLSVRDLEDGRAPHSTYVELTDGDILESSEFRFKSNSTVHRYVPVVGGQAEQPALFLRLSERQSLRESNGSIRGLLEVNGLEGELRSQLDAAHAIAGTHYVLGVGRAPSPEVGGAMAAFGLLLCIGALIWFRARYVSTAAVDGEVR